MLEFLVFVVYAIYVGTVLLLAVIVAMAVNQVITKIEEKRRERIRTRSYR